MTLSSYDAIELFCLTDPTFPTAIADDDTIAALGDELATLLIQGLTGTGLGAIAPRLGNQLVTMLHREVGRLRTDADTNAQRIRSLVARCDGSEIEDVALQDAQARQTALDDTTSALEVLRDQAAEAYTALTGETWTPRSGSRTGRRLTAAQVEAREMLRARTAARADALSPEGTPIAVTGATGNVDHERLFRSLDRTKARFPDMVLVTKGAKGVEALAAGWASRNNVAHIVVRPDWTRDQRAAPFRANDRILGLKPAGIIVAGGNGVAQNLAQKAAKRRIKVWDIAPGDERIP